jgi:hypothetical protein
MNANCNHRNTNNSNTSSAEVVLPISFNHNAIFSRSVLANCNSSPLPSLMSDAARTIAGGVSSASGTNRNAFALPLVNSSIFYRSMIANCDSLPPSAASSAASGDGSNSEVLRIPSSNSESYFDNEDENDDDDDEENDTDSLAAGIVRAASRLFRSTSKSFAKSMTKAAPRQVTGNRFIYSSSHLSPPFACF